MVKFYAIYVEGHEILKVFFSKEEVEEHLAKMKENREYPKNPRCWIMEDIGYYELATGKYTFEEGRRLLDEETEHKDEEITEDNP